MKINFREVRRDQREGLVRVGIREDTEVGHCRR